MSVQSKSDLPETKRRILDAGVELMRVRGFNATTVDDICSGAGVTKGGFFHYFKSKEDLALAAVELFQGVKMELLTSAPFRELKDPLDRVFGRLDFEKQLILDSGRTARGCLIGMFAQELAVTHETLRDACHEYFSQAVGQFQDDLDEAKAAYAPKSDFEPKKLAMFLVSVLQGSLILAKSSGSNKIRSENIDEFRQYLQLLFGSVRRTASGRKAVPAGA